MSERFRHIIIASLSTLGALMPAASALAEQKPARVVLSPHFYALEETQRPELSSLNDAASKGSRDYFAHHATLFEAISSQSTSSAILAQERYAEDLELARGMRDIGLERYRELKPQEAIEYLVRARSAYLRVRHNIIAPEEVSEVLFYLALSYLEQGEGAAKALGVLREMVLLDPTREIKAGYFPENVVNAYQLARRGVMQELERRGLPLELDSVARSLATLVQSEYVALGFIVPSERGGGYVARLFVWSANTGKVEFADEQFVVRGEDPLVVSEAFSRMSARWADCIKAPPAEVTNQGGIRTPDPDTAKTIGLDLSFSYATYLGFPRLRQELGPAPPGTIAHFGNFGVNVGVQWILRRELAAIARAQVLVSQREHSGLIDARDVTALRGFVGVEMGMRFGRFRPGMQLALEAMHVSDFSILGEISCAPQDRSGECAPELSSDFYEDHNLLLGLNLAPVLTWRINDTLDLLSMTTISYYLFSTADGEEINLPWSGEFGVRYRF